MKFGFNRPSVFEENKFENVNVSGLEQNSMNDLVFWYS